MRRAISLVELLLVIAILAMLVSLLMPAVQAARESSRRMQCSSNLRQVALALHQYEQVHGVLPAGNQQAYSFLVPILPFVGQQPLYDSIDWNVYGYRAPQWQRDANVALFKCPSDGLADYVKGTANYVGNTGHDAQVHGYNGAFDPGGARGSEPPQRFSFNAFTDGLSNTAMLSEYLISDAEMSLLRTNWLTAECFAAGRFDEFISACENHEFQTLPNGNAAGEWARGLIWIEGQPGQTLYAHALTPNKLSCVNCGMSPYGAYTAASNHPGGVNVTAVDGSTRFVVNSIDLRVWRAEGTRSAGD